MKARLTLILILLTCLTLVTNSFTYANTLDPNTIVADSAILMDADTGQILFSKNADKQQFPASTTKALTALIIAEDLKLDETVTIDKEAPFTDGSRIYVIEGETFSVEQLLYAMLLESANDAAVALAKHHSGTIEQFAKKMNERAKALGCTQSNFVTPNGLPNDAHLSTAHDLALIGQAFQKHPELMKIVQTYKYDIPPTNKQPEPRHLHNSNRFLYGTGSRNKIQYNGQTIDIKWDAVTGLKTGYTNAAQQCFIVSATQNNRNLIAVILKSKGNNLYIDPRTLLEYGFNQFKPFSFATKGQLIQSVDIKSEKKARIDLYTSNDVKALIPLEANEKDITHDVIVNPNIKLPVSENQVLGQLKISYKGQVLTQTNLVSLNSIGAKATLDDKTTRYVSWIPIDQSPKALTILGLRILGAIILWQLILRFLGGPKKKRRQKPRPQKRPVSSAMRPLPDNRPNAQTKRPTARPVPPRMAAGQSGRSHPPASHRAPYGDVSQISDYRPRKQRQSQ